MSSAQPIQMNVPSTFNAITVHSSGVISIPLNAQLSSTFPQDPGSTRHHLMFVSQVLVGKYTTGRPGIKKPPPINEATDPYTLYDSCVDHIARPKIYVVFDKMQVYPEHVIEYESVDFPSYQ
jgi:poly [ADP-ribose] polymerase 10/14/15